MTKKRGWTTCLSLLLYAMIAGPIIYYGQSNPRNGAFLLGSFSTVLNVVFIITLGFVWKTK